MEATQENTSQGDVLEIKVYVPINEVTERQQGIIDNAIKKHPRDRKYLSNTSHGKIFAPSKNEADAIIEHAKSKNWEVTYDKKAREITIKVKSENGIGSDNTNPSLHEALKFLNTQGDIHLDSKDQENRDTASPEDIVDPTKKTGFVKTNQEKRVGRGTAIPIQEPKHGHSALEIAEVYNFPEGDGAKQTIGIIELGGKFEESDLKTFFAQYDMKVPKIQVVGEPATTPINDNVEVTADIQVAGVLAPKAKLVIYYGTSILNAMKSALADTKNKLSVISISWAGSELGYSLQEITELNNVFKEAALKGITVIGASGDNGALNKLKFANVNVPVNFEHVLGCGGTKLNIANDEIISETVWNESTPQTQIGSGGGFSQRVSEPRYQKTAIQNYITKYPQFEPYQRAGGKGIPDVGANAADASGYAVFFEGNWVKIGGTSLATPLWAALIARINQNLGYNLGFITEHLYELMDSPAFDQIIEGNNNLYLAASGWNPCTGLGTPNGQKLMEAIEGLE
ncbi:S53 family peptidase [Kordia sp. YSTF-M3]|uniref:S53 family peptidase n=1 Tax=Kordia aestuariivivens TaxID=2759037 RepID=A0ABR7QA55_9FLAO|nr:S53 family peptidase [Kordia aestuariivivens]MBC8755445.1 S53 family peptidase [Kordia aestuariivivens]